jgi:hypothetical protein
MEKHGDEIQFAIARSIAVLGESRGGWKKELNLVSWNGREPKLDIRDWDPTHQRMGKGLTFTREEAEVLCTALGTYLSAEAGGSNQS